MTSTEALDPFNSGQEKINIKLSMVASVLPQVSPVNTVETGLAVVSVNPLSTLTNTYWKLMKLNGETVTMAGQQKREAYIQLNAEQETLKGFGSCNQFQGSFTVKGNDLSFGPVAATRIACLEGMTVESHFFNVLELTSYYSINEHDLTLLDNAKHPIERFQAQYLN